jgi:hypothetical protein
MTLEVNVIVQGVEHVLRGARATRFNDIMSRKLQEHPELQHAGRLERQTAEASAYYESEGTDNG